MWTWLTRLFRSSSTADRAEAEGRVEEAARLHLEHGDRDQAVAVFLRAGETARTLEERRAWCVRAYAVARTAARQDEARRGLALVGLAEAEASLPRTPEDRRRLVEAAADLERLGLLREAGRAYTLLEDREAMVRVLTQAGDVETLERETGADETRERLGLRRRAAVESFDMLWRSGDRARALGQLRAWVDQHGEDHEARQLLDERQALLLTAGRASLEVDGHSYELVGRYPVVLGREGDVVVRGGTVSRRHTEIRRTPAGDFLVADAGSRAGTQLDGIAVAAPITLLDGHAIHLGTDLVLRARALPDDRGYALEIERGMDRGRVLVLLAGRWSCPLGVVRFDEGGPVLEPRAPVVLAGQRIAVAITLARGDRVEADGHELKVIG